MAKLKQNQFYCVSCRSKRTAKADDMGVTSYRNSRMKGGSAPALKAECSVCGTPLTKFISPDDKTKLTNKYGKW